MHYHDEDFDSKASTRMSLLQHIEFHKADAIRPTLSPRNFVIKFKIPSRSALPPFRV